MSQRDVFTPDPGSERRPLRSSVTSTELVQIRTRIAEGSSDREFCEQILPRVSRTFGPTIALLPAALREAVGAAYLLCRIVDCIEDDDALEPGERGSLFDGLDAVLRDDAAPAAILEALCVRAEVGETSAERELCAHAGRVIRSFRRLSPAEREAIRPELLEMSRGMREYCARAGDRGVARIADLEDLERYCEFVAGTVGRLLTALFELEVGRPGSAEPEELRRLGGSFGRGLQLVNVLKDIAGDLERGVCFLPRSLAAAEGIALEDVLDPARRDAALRIVDTLSARAQEHLGDAERYVLAWPAPAGADVRLFCAVPLLLALASLREVRSANDVLVPGRTPKVSREEVA
jgi:phytoene/squalene synthetase